MNKNNKIQSLMDDILTTKIRIQKNVLNRIFF